MAKKYVYAFEKGNKELKDILGGKGANLAEMTSLGIPVPPGFTITTEVCKGYYDNNQKYPEGVLNQIDDHLEKLEKKMGKKLGDKEDPLLVSVRSGAAISMPGMMDTVLNLGLNDSSVYGVIKKTGNERFGWDSYRRFINMFGDVVMGVSHEKFEEKIEEMKKSRGVDFDTELTAEDLKELVEQYKQVVKKETGIMFPREPRKQLQMAIDAVFKSWNTDRAIAYRRINDIKGLLGTAVNVQTMVFGNMGETSATGVFFTRDPSTGENRFYGEFLVNAQGEDVVAGIRTPRPISDLRRVLPKCYDQLVDIYKKIEKHYTDMQDMEFTIENEKLYILQTRTGKRTAHAAVKIAVEMVEEKLISKKTAILRVDPGQLDQLLHKQLDPVAKKSARLLAKGLPASPGAAVGQIVFTANRAHDWAKDGKTVILVRKETSPNDIEGMNAAEGILTSRGGMTSHAAVVARGMGKCCIAGCGDLSINEKKRMLVVKGIVLKEGDYVTLDGGKGEVFEDKIRVVDPHLSTDFKTLINWADEYRKLAIMTNADTPSDARKAKRFGAEGIGLCRTEHMFFGEGRIKAIREMILADTIKGRKKALGKIKPMQKGDFKGIFKVMDGLPVIIRLLDPPLHEFLPKTNKEIKELAADMEIQEDRLIKKLDALQEVNPMLGFRGCRLSVEYPEITEMQTRAIFEAALEVQEDGIKPLPCIEVPLVGGIKEFALVKGIIEEVAEQMQIKGKINYKIGTMIEVPRAAITADKIAEEADFISFGTNDLTQMGCGISRDDVGLFMDKYLKANIYEKDPFQTIDREGIGELMKICVEKARSAKKNIEIGICGEHGGDPSSIEFCQELGLDNVSCSPYRVPIARLAAAHAVLKSKQATLQ